MSAIERVKAGAGWVWKHTAAGVALVLIVLALWVGYSIGVPAQEEESHEHAEAQAESGEPRMYTCSMHPQIRLPDPDAKCPICFMDLIPVSGDGGGAGNGDSLTISAAAAELAGVETTEVGRFFPTAEVRLYGKVTYDETSVARLTAYFPSRIERLFVNFVGVPVKRGEHLAEVYSPELLASFEELRQAQQAAGSGEGIVQRASRDTVRAAREKLRLFGLTGEQIAAVEDGTLDSDRLTVFAPIGGVVTHLSVREGDYVQTGDPIATVADLSRLWLDLEAYESQLALLRWGQPVAFTVESHPGEVFEGRVSFIEPMVDQRTRTAAVRIAVDNADGRLKPGMFASAVVRALVGEGGVVADGDLGGRWVCPMHPMVVADGPGACGVCGMDLVPAGSLGVGRDRADAVEPLVVPRSAVLFTGSRSVVYVAAPDAEAPTYEAREVVLGPRAGDFYIVRSGLDEGESVVTHGAFRIDSAMQIAAKRSMMSPGATAEDRFDAPEGFVHSLKPVYAAYLDAQEALAADDLEGYRRAAGDLKTAVGLVEAAQLVGEPLNVWRRVASGLRPVGDPGTLEQARAGFGALSGAVIELETRFGHHGSETWHAAHCPMAFDNAGADWLQRGERVNNPYYGSMMLRCGNVTASFPPLGAEKPAAGGHRHD